jgi:syntaxin 1B/2/3
MPLGSIKQAAKSQYRTQLERQFRIAKPNASSQEVRQALNSDGNVFQQQILSSRVGDQRRMLQEVQNRQHDLEKIEQSLVELFELMQEMQMILEQQQSFVNTIETNLDETAVNIEMGSTELTRATETSRSSRKKKWYVVCVV